MNIQAMHDRLESFRVLKDNWDSDGSPAISDEAISRGHLFIDFLEALGCTDGFPAPTSWGGVCFEFGTNTDFMLDIEPGTDSMEFSIFKMGDNGIEDEIEGFICFKTKRLQRS